MGEGELVLDGGEPTETAVAAAGFVAIRPSPWVLVGRLIEQYAVTHWLRVV